MSMIAAKRSALTKPLLHGIRKLRELGVLRGLKNRWLTEVEKKHDSVLFKEIGWEQAVSLFTAYGVLVAVAVAIFVVELSMNLPSLIAAGRISSA